MKHIYSLLLAAGCSLTAMAQSESNVSRWYLGVNAKGGVHTYDAEQIDIAANYLNSINPSIGTVTYTAGNSMGFDVQVGYFIGKKANFGFGTGLFYLKQSGDAELDKFVIHYQNRDYTNDVYRQIVTLKAPIAEEIKSTNVNIPIVLKYRTNLSKAFGFAIDAGIVCNLSMRHRYTTNASFDYEAVYKFQRMSDGTWFPVYDNSTDAGTYEWKGMTISETERTRSASDVNAHFNALRAQGYNVGVAQKPRATGYESYKAGSIGFLVQPSLAFRISKAVSLNVGGYYLYQKFEVPGERTWQLTSNVGSYSSIMGAQKNVKMQNYGGSLGLGFNL
ncbi:MAG: hypothetical protein EOP56_15500 [Sphingobacteriales bacterium]|nr:MAG: hypothetical protein EOP56_15500 [Sphingobacteriales bacterium]